MRTKKDVQVSYSVSRSFALVSSLVESQWLRSLCDSLLAFCCFLNLKRVEIIDLSHIVHENLAEKRLSQKKNVPFIVLCICSFVYRFWRMCINNYPSIWVTLTSAIYSLQTFGKIFKKQQWDDKKPTFANSTIILPLLSSIFECLNIPHNF